MAQTHSAVSLGHDRRRAIAETRASAEHALDRLAELLIRPLDLEPTVPLVIVPARRTHRIPWAALWPAPVSVAPSASLWVRTRQRAAGGGGVVVVGGPGLPGAEREVAEVAGHHSDPLVMVPPYSTVDDVLAAMEKADLVHLACHSLLRSDNPMFSALEVTDGG
jgi:CHAT domain-containing protein